MYALFVAAHKKEFPFLVQVFIFFILLFLHFFTQDHSLAKAVVMFIDQTFYEDALNKYFLVQHRINTSITVSLNFFYLRRVYFDQRKQCMKDLASLTRSLSWRKCKYYLTSGYYY